MKLLHDVKFEIARAFNHKNFLLHELREQFYFGAREVLIRYMGLSDKTILLAYIQHGVPRILKSKPSFIGVGRIIDLTWYKDVLTPNKSVSFNSNYRSVPIGAPWIYMKKNLENDKVDLNLNTFKKKHTLFVMPHSSNFEVINVDRKFENYLIQNLVDGILLFNEDFLNPQIRRLAEQNKINIECAGLPRTYQPTVYQTNAGGRPNFLLESYKIFLRYKNVICSDFSTALVYAANSGANIGILNSWKPKWSVLSSIESKITDQKEFKKNNLEQYFPFKLNKIHSGNSVYEWSNEILGSINLKNPQDLLRLIPYIEDFLPNYKTNVNI